MKDSVFFGEEKTDLRPNMADVLATLSRLTGSTACAEELIEASDSVERGCPEASLMPMPEWIQ
jgi:hypothetical protein